MTPRCSGRRRGSGELTLGVGAELLQEGGEAGLLVGVEAAGRGVHRGGVLAEGGGDERLPRRGEVDDARAPVRRVEAARDELSRLQAVDRGGHGAAGEVDPAAEARIEAGDRQRLTRAWAVAQHTGRALSDWTADTTPLLAPGSWTGLVIEPEREALYANCDLRVADLVEGGALDEVRALMARALDPALPAMKAVGVREFAAHLTGETTLAAAVEATRQATRNYAKRQLTWFRNQTPGWARV